nr:7-methylguanosine phosphate-specific 5'-nucleotidase A-like [Ipomoea batatas]
MEKVAIDGSDSEVVVDDAHSLLNKISAIRTSGPSKLQVIADFDGTLTKYWINGRRGQSECPLQVSLHYFYFWLK